MNGTKLTCSVEFNEDGRPKPTERFINAWERPSQEELKWESDILVVFVSSPRDD